MRRFMKNFNLSLKNKGINISLLILFLLLFNHFGYPQNFTDTVGIPVVLFTGERPQNVYSSDLDSMKNIAGIIHQSDVGNSLVNLMYQKGLKVIPYQIWSANNYIIQYTDAHYTVWEAEGTPAEKGNVTLEYNHNLASEYYENDRLVGVKTNPGAQPGNIISGPGYRQNGKYKINTIRVDYTADFRLKIIPFSPYINLLEPEYQNNVVCTLKVTTKQKTHAGLYWDSTEVSALPIDVHDTILYVRDFVSSGWNTFLIRYDWSKGGVPVEKNKNIKANDYEGQYVEFIVDWGGSPYFSLIVDKIKTYDQRGKDLAEVDSIATLLDLDAHTLQNQDAIYLWNATDEQRSIDNYEPYRIVDSMVNAKTNGTKRIISTINTLFNGRYGACQDGSFKYYVAEEFWKRARPLFL